MMRHHQKVRDTMLVRLKFFCLKAWMSRLAAKESAGQLQADHAKTTRIVLWQFGGVGDMLLCTPAILALQKVFPDAKLHVWCSDPQFAGFLKRFQSVQGVYAFPVYDFDSRTLLHSDTRRAFRRIGDAMAEQKPDMLVNLHIPALLDWWAVEWWLIRRLSPAFSLGFDPRFLQGRSVFDVSLNAAERDGTHYTRLYCRLLEKAGTPCGEATHFPVTDEEKAQAKLLLTEAAPDGKWVCMHLGARRLKVEGKTWPIERFVVLAEKLLEAGFLPVLIGVEGEREMVNGLCAGLPRCANLVGHTSLGEMAALIAQCDGFIGHDSGPFHVAAAVGTPCLAICGRPDAEAEYLDYRRNDVNVLMADFPLKIEVNDVFEAAVRMLKHG